MWYPALLSAGLRGGLLGQGVYIWVRLLEQANHIIRPWNQPGFAPCLQVVMMAMTICISADDGGTHDDDDTWDQTDGIHDQRQSEDAQSNLHQHSSCRGSPGI